MTDEHVMQPTGGPLLTRPVQVLSALFAAAGAVVLYRFVFGIGAVSALNDAYPWGPWKVLSVIVFTAYASGGYAVALLVYVMNRRQYHALARTALLTSAVGYTAAVVTLGIDIGRPWNFWRLIIVTGWNTRSVLLEIAVCISTYIIFLWLEMAPPFLERWKTSEIGALRRTAVKATPVLDRWLPWIVAMAVVLPSMHQSSLGSLMLLAGPRLHPYWQTPLLPLLFLLSCWLLGYAFVIAASLLSSLAWRRPLQLTALASLSQVMAWVICVFSVLRVSDLLARGTLRSSPMTGYTALLLVEVGLTIGPALWLIVAVHTLSPRRLFAAACAVLVGGGLYRLDTALVGFMPGPQYRYFPSVAEILVTVGFTAAAILAYVVIVKYFAILPARVPERTASAHV
jgi:Ni/Fe-hydrogenase subunit HybB-like protein